MRIFKSTIERNRNALSKLAIPKKHGHILRNYWIIQSSNLWGLGLIEIPAISQNRSCPPVLRVKSVNGSFCGFDDLKASR